ncbi:hypothetical protein [Frondihabitans australicus]|uniref:hypothetical protein n=1 Tax=Frondihabitans australicus TaxID=386892 RepID=UPI000EB1A827|nr:hypothetical protein [Frondihabitans australicus]
MSRRTWTVIWSVALTLFGIFTLLSRAAGVIDTTTLSATLETVGGSLLVICGVVGLIAAIRRPS